MGGEKLWHLLTHNQLMSPQGPHLVYTVQLKATIKAQISGRMVSKWYKVAFPSVYSEKTRLKKLMMMKMIILLRLIITRACKRAG